MQVDPKPSPWPCVVMLIGLLLFCLTVPQYWQDTPDGSLGVDEHEILAVEPALSSADVLKQPVPQSLAAYGQAALGFSIGTAPNAGLLTLCPTPTIEELVESARIGSAGYYAKYGLEQPYATAWPTYALPQNNSMTPWQLPELTPQVTIAGTGVSSPLLAAALRRVGHAMAVYSVAEAVPRLAWRAVNWYQAWVPERTAYRTPSPSASTLRLITPGDRLAMRPPVADTKMVWSPPAKPAQDQDTDAQTSNDPWCVPQVLYAQLDRLARHPYSAQWAQATLAQLHAVTQCQPHGSDVPPLLLEITRSAQDAISLAEQTTEDRLRVELLRAHWGLARRLDCWMVMHDIRVAERAGNRIASRGSLHNLFDIAHDPGSVVESEAALTSELETYERSRDPQLGRLVAEQRQALESSSNSLDQSLADAVERHYRNANVRVAITATMLNRLVGGERSQVQAVRERIAGTPVRGESLTMSESHVRLEPATGRWQLGLEAQGVVESNTLANGGRARLRSFGATDFTAQKTVVVDPQGVRMERTVVDATNHSRLAGVTTDFDWVPVFSSYARSRAVQQYRAKRSRAKAEVEYKVAAQATDAMDRETLDAVEHVQRAVRERLTGPLADCGVELTPIELTTTNERLVARLRVAGDHQLGSHTPRPRALSDSLASVQVHESALTNAAIGLALDGRRYTAAELQTALREKFPRMATDDPPKAGDETVFEFAYRDAAQFRFDKGRIELMLSFTNFEHHGKATRDFIVHAFYVPVVDGLSAELVRDGALGIEGRLTSTERARLHNAFNEVLAADRRLSIVPLGPANDPRLGGIVITQMVIEDGWVGVAIGPGEASRVAERSRSLR